MCGCTLACTPTPPPRRHGLVRMPGGRSRSILAYCAETMREAELVDFRVWYAALPCRCVSALAQPQPSTFTFGRPAACVLRRVLLELFFTVAFTLEIVLRSVAAWQTRTQRKFIKDPLIWVDIMSITPFYFLAVSCALDASSPWGERCGDLRNAPVLKVLQAVKILRVFKLFRHFSHTRLLVRSFQRSYAALLPAMLFLFVSSALFAGLVYSLENALTEDSVFESVVDAVYFSFVTITTVGYGDQVPQVRCCVAWWRRSRATGLLQPGVDTSPRPLPAACLRAPPVGLWRAFSWSTGSYLQPCLSLSSVRSLSRHGTPLTTRGSTSGTAPRGPCGTQSSRLWRSRSHAATR